MTYLDLIRDADRQLDDGRITIGEYEQMIEPLKREIDHVAESDIKVSISCAHENDLIFRQAAIDALDVLCQEHRYKIPGKRETYSQYNEAWQDALDRAEGAIFNLPTVQPDHTADVSKKVERTAEIAQNVQDEDLISRKAAIDALARMMPRSYTPDGSHPADEEIFRAQEIFADCIEALEILPSAQPETCEGCKHLGKWENEVEYGYLSPCTRCKRRVGDHYER